MFIGYLMEGALNLTCPPACHVVRARPRLQVRPGRARREQAVLLLQPGGKIRCKQPIGIVLSVSNGENTIVNSFFMK